MADFDSLKPEVGSWNLYTDEKLVSKLDSFLNHMMNQCEIIHKNAELTLYETEAVSVYLNDTFNALSNLSNKKFIENSMAPLEEPQIPQKEVKQRQEMTIEKKTENFQKALKNAIDVFGISNNDDDTTELTKSNTMSMSSIFKSGDHLPFIVGSKAFAQDEFLGIIDRTDTVDKYLRELNRDALEDDHSSPLTGNGGANQSQIGSNPGANSIQGSMASSTVMSAGSAGVSGGLFPPPPVIPGATNVVLIKNTTLGPPPPFKVALEVHEAKKAQGRGGAGTGAGPNLMQEIASRGDAAPAGGRGGLLAEISSRGQPNAGPGPGGRAGLLSEISARGQDSQETPAPQGGRAGLLAEISSRGQLNAGPGPGGRAGLLSEIASKGQEREAAPQGGRAGLLSEIAQKGQEREAAPQGGRAGLLAEISQKGQEREAAPPGGRGGLLAEIASKGQERQAAPPGGRGGLLAEIAAKGQEREAAPQGGRAGLMNEIASRGQQESAAPQVREKTLQEQLNEKLAQRNNPGGAPPRTSNYPAPSDEGPSARRVSDIKSNPLYQPIQVQASKPAKLFDDEDEDDAGNGDLFKSSNNNKKKFENLLAAPGTTGLNNPLLGSNVNPFDPFGLQNPFLPFNPKSKEAQAAAQRSEERKQGKDNLMGLANNSGMYDEPRPSKGGYEEPKEDKTAKTSKLNKLFEDSDEDDESRFNKQRLLSQKYRADIKPRVEEVPAPTQKSAKVSSMFNDDDDDGFLSKKGAATQAKKPLATIDDEDNFLGKKSQVKKEEPKPAAKNTKPSLFDDDDGPLGGIKKKPEPKAEPKLTTSIAPKKKKGVFDDDDDEEEEKVVQKPAQKPSIQNTEPPKEKKSLFGGGAAEEPVSKPVVREEPKPIVREEPKPIVREEPKPIVREEPKPIIREEPKMDIRQPEIFKPIEASPTSKPAQDSSPTTEAPKVAATNLTQLIKAAHMKKKQKDSSDEDSEESDDAPPPPVRKPVEVKPVQPVVQEEVAPRVKEEETPKQVESKPLFNPVKEEPEPSTQVMNEARNEEPAMETENRPSVSKQGSQANISSKISALQNQLNLNMGALRPMEGLPEHMRKPKPSIQRDEETEAKEQEKAVMAESGEFSHTAVLDKPVTTQTRAKKTLLFEDDEEEEDQSANKFISSSSVKVEKKVVEEPKIVEEPKPIQPAMVSEPRGSMSGNQSGSMSKKVTFDEEDEPLGFTKKPSSSGPKTQSDNNPLDLLRGLKGLEAPGSNKSPKKSAKDAFRDDDDDAPSLGAPSKQSSQTSKPIPSSNQSDPNNPLALLSGLKMMDEGRKSMKTKSKGKSKGLFDDDDDDGGFVSKKSTDESKVAPKKQASKPKLFGDSDEDDDFLKKKPAAKPQQTSKARKNLFDDD